MLRVRLSRVCVLAVLPLPLAPQALDDVLVHVANVDVPRLNFMNSTWSTEIERM